MMTLDEFRATGIDCADLGTAIEDESLMRSAGRLYLGVLYIEHWTDDRAGDPPANGPTWLLTLGNQQPEGELADMESRLYDWAMAEGYGDEVLA